MFKPSVLVKILSLIIAIALLLPLSAVAQDGGDEAQPDPLGGATEFATLDERTSVTLMLDWVPNTNHTGIYVAQEKGYYDEANLDVEIIEPSDVLPETALDTGLVEFGIGFQEFSSFAIAEGRDIVSVAAIIQSNTSGFATIAGDHSIERPADLANLTYGGFSMPDMENAVLSRLLECDDAEWDEDNYMDIGFADPLELLDRERIDFAWIFFGVQGIRSQVQDRELDIIMLNEYTDCVPDYYTPILLTSGDMVEESPEVVEAFVQATARGYADAIQNPAEAAEILIGAVPELDAEFVRESVAWFAPRYQGNAARWGQQSLDVWQAFTDFMVEFNLIEEAFAVEEVFTNEFLPGSVESEAEEAE
jgi:ABC-type nitrate/sulfonate/bicarbonate transport system substrate-binding protein